MSLIKAIKAQFGLSVTPANNFVLDASADNGTMKLARGNAGATTQDILTVNAAGKVAFPQNTLVGFTGSFGGSGIAANGLISFSPVRNDGGYFSAGRFTPLVAGWYSLSASVHMTITGGTYGGVDIKFNGSIVRRQVQGPYSTTDFLACVSAEMYFNGTTDYAEFWYIAAPTGGTLTANSYCSGSLLQRG